jgi:dipeptidyl aminopeptidase/acylaminoacyl peptidase
MSRPALATALVPIWLITSVSCATRPCTRGGICAEGEAPAAGSGQASGRDTTGGTTPGPIAPTGEHAFSVLDLLDMKRLSDPQVSPDGKRIVFGLRTTDLEQNRGRSDLWATDVSGGEPERLTKHPEGDGGARWAPDGETLYFLSTRSGSSQVYRLAGDEEPKRVTDLPVSVGNLIVSPDGKHLAFSAEVFVDCPDLACTAKRLEQRKQAQESGMVYDGLFVRHWDTWKDGRRSHLFVMPAEGGEPVDVTRGLDADVPTKPWGGPEEIAFSPDGEQVVFTARDVGREEAWSTNFDLFVAPIDGSSAPKKLTANPAWDTHPVFSPDGKTLAYLAMKRPGFEADRFRIVLRTWKGGEERILADKWDRSVRDMLFSPNGNKLLVTASDVGQVSLFSIDVTTGEAAKLASDGTISAPSYAGDRLIFLRNDLGHPNELWTTKHDGSDLTQLSHFNDSSLSLAKRGDSEQFSFAGAAGHTVYAYVVKPVDFDEKKKYPIAFLIHGGPQGSFGNRFHYRWNPQTYAGAGYAVVMVDFHGSRGYGQKFTDSISGDWGGKPLTDLKKGLAAATDRYAWMDAGRVCALGASYGGFMVNWIAGKWPRQFKCLVTHDGVFDHRSMYYSTEELWFPEWDIGGPYFEKPRVHEKYNPARLVDKWETPIMVIHGALDFRVPLEQGLAAYTAAQRRGIKSRFLYFPDENHWVLKPRNSIQWHREVFRWLDEHLRE